MYYFPNAEDRIIGIDGFDLANSYYKGVIKRGDRLRIGVPGNTKEAPNELVEVFYYRPGLIFLPQGRAGMHSFLSTDPDNTAELTMNPLGWTKTGSVSPEEFFEAMRKIYGETEIGYRIFAAAHKKLTARHPAAEPGNSLLKLIPKPDF